MNKQLKLMATTSLWVMLIASSVLAAGDSISARLFAEKTILPVTGRILEDSLTESPSGEKVAFIVESEGKKSIVLNGQKGNAFDNINSDSMFFIQNGRSFIYIATQNGKNLVVKNGQAGKPYALIMNHSLVINPDGTEYSYIAKTGDKWVVVTNEAEGRQYDEISGNTLAYNPLTQEWVYAARTGNYWQLVRNGVEEKKYDGIRAHVFSPDGKRSAMVVREAGKTYVVLDGTPGVPFENIRPGSLTFSPDSRHLTYVAHHDGKQLVITDDVQGLFFDEIAGRGVKYSSDGNHSAYVAKLDGKWYLIRDNQPGFGYEEIDVNSIVFSHNGAKLAFAVKQENKWRYIVNGKEDNLFDEIKPESFLFSPDNLHYCYIGKHSNKWAVVQNGLPGRYYGDISVKSLMFSPDSENLLYTSRKDNQWMAVLDGKEGRLYDAVYIRQGHNRLFQDELFFTYFALKGGILIKVDERIVGKTIKDKNRDSISDPNQVYRFRFNPPHGTTFIQTIKKVDTIDSGVLERFSLFTEIKIKNEYLKTTTGFRLKMTILSYDISSDSKLFNAKTFDLSKLKNIIITADLDVNGHVVGIQGMEQLKKQLDASGISTSNGGDFLYSRGQESNNFDMYQFPLRNLMNQFYKMGEVIEWTDTYEHPMSPSLKIETNSQLKLLKEVELGRGHKGLLLNYLIKINPESLKQLMNNFLAQYGVADKNIDMRMDSSITGDITIDPQTMLIYSHTLDMWMEIKIGVPGKGQMEMKFTSKLTMQFDYQ